MLQFSFTNPFAPPRGPSAELHVCPGTSHKGAGPGVLGGTRLCSAVHQTFVYFHVCLQGHQARTHTHTHIYIHYVFFDCKYVIIICIYIYVCQWTYFVIIYNIQHQTILEYTLRAQEWAFMVFAVMLDLRSLVAFCILRVVLRTGADISWFLPSHLISYCPLCCILGVAPHTGMDVFEG